MMMMPSWLAKAAMPGDDFRHSSRSHTDSVQEPVQRLRVLEVEYLCNLVDPRIKTLLDLSNVRAELTEIADDHVDNEQACQSCDQSRQQ